MKNWELSPVLDVKYSAYLFEKVLQLSLQYSLETKGTHSTCCYSEQLYKRPQRPKGHFQRPNRPKRPKRTQRHKRHKRPNRHKRHKRPQRPQRPKRHKRPKRPKRPQKPKDLKGFKDLKDLTWNPKTQYSGFRRQFLNF